jgi:hypothetical protein
MAQALQNRKSVMDLMFNQLANQVNNKHNSLSAKPFNVKGEVLQMKGKTKRPEFSFK